MFLLVYNLYGQTSVKYFNVQLKGRVYFNWKVESNKKELVYELQGTNDRSNYTTLFKIEAPPKEFQLDLLTIYCYFRLKIWTSKTEYFYSDVVNVKCDDPLQILPDMNGLKQFYIVSYYESGTVYIYDKNVIVQVNEFQTGHNIIEHSLPKGSYTVMAFTETFTKSITLVIP
jgi:hypothetical protein